MNVSIVKHTDTGEVKLFSGGVLIGRYKSENDALAHLSTALVELTAAQQRVAELERENAELNRSLGWHKMQLERDRARLQEMRDSWKHPYDE